MSIQSTNCLSKWLLFNYCSSISEDDSYEDVPVYEDQNCITLGIDEQDYNDLSDKDINECVF